MKNKFFPIALALISFFSCKNGANETQTSTDSIVKAVDSVVAEMHNSQNSLDWVGTYKGIIPCADCEGIETEITLNKDLVYTIKTKYLGKGDNRFFEGKGSFHWDVTGEIILLEGLAEKPSQYKVDENSLTQLDMGGKIITGVLAEKYVLRK